MENIYLSALKMLFALAAMLFAALVCYRYMGKWRLKLNLNLKPKGQRYGLQKTDTIHLGYRKFVSVIEVHDRVLVIGVGDKEMALLTEWKNEESAT
jgi:flagellar biogenesis protein FliO